jgi:hypothetical protein
MISMFLAANAALVKEHPDWIAGLLPQFEVPVVLCYLFGEFLSVHCSDRHSTDAGAGILQTAVPHSVDYEVCEILKDCLVLNHDEAL